MSARYVRTRTCVRVFPVSLVSTYIRFELQSQSLFLATSPSFSFWMKRRTTRRTLTTLFQCLVDSGVLMSTRRRIFPSSCTHARVKGYNNSMIGPISLFSPFKQAEYLARLVNCVYSHLLVSACNALRVHSHAWSLHLCLLLLDETKNTYYSTSSPFRWNEKYLPGTLPCCDESMKTNL